MMYRRAVVSTVLLVFSVMFLEKLDAMSLRPMNCPANQEPGCRPCWGGTCESLSNYQQLSCSGLCNPGCVCKKDHYLQNNQCVHVSKCNVQCPANMVFNPCVKKTITCKTLNSGAVEYDECVPRCQCVEGYIFSGEKPQDCIKMSECQKKTNAS